MRDVDELEWKLRAVAVPVAFAIALAFHATGTGHWLQRTFLTMVPHELGHAMTAWWCGFAAIPGLWKTLVPEARSTVVIVVVGAAEALLVWRGWLTQSVVLWGAGLLLAIAQYVGTSVISRHTTDVAITFGGDGGAMVIGAVLVLLFFVPPGSRLQTTGLRWGFLAIGAATLVDTSATWFAARGNPDAIPFGEIEGVGLSDPSKLEDLGWTTHQLVNRYTLLATICLAIVALAWASAVWTARRKLKRYAR